jgi:hypothetical protein
MAIILNDSDGPKFLELLREVLTGVTTPQVRQTALRFLEAVYTSDRPHVDATEKVTLSYAHGREIVSVPVKNYHEMEQFVREGKKIQAIKVLRECSGIGLKEAKDFIEQAEQFKPYYKLPMYGR